MMDENDPRVKKLQELAWSLQSCSNKPGGKLPEDYKRECYRATSRAIGLCQSAVYTEESDFLQRAAKLTKELEAKKAECQGVEESVKQKLAGQCLRSAGTGGYTVGKREDSYFLPPPKKVDPMAEFAEGTRPQSTPAQEAARLGAGAQLSAADVAARCRDEPEALSLCGLGLRDCDIDALCFGLREAGAGLTALNLSHNAIGDTGVQRLATELARGSCPQLAEMWLGGNAFGALGMEVLGAGLGALRRGLTVRTEDLSAAEAGAAGDELVAEARRPPPVLPVAPQAAAIATAPAATAAPAVAPAPAAAPAATEAPAASPRGASTSTTPSTAAPTTSALTFAVPTAEASARAVSTAAASAATEFGMDEMD